MQVGARDRLVETHLHVAERVASQLLPNLPPHVEREDLVSAGYLGLVQAAGAYDPLRGVKFETFATSVVRQAMCAHLRQEDVLPRKVRERLRQIEEAEAEAPQATEGQIAERLGWREEKLGRARQEVSRCYHSSLEKVIRTDDHAFGRTTTLADLIPDPEPGAHAELVGEEQRMSVAVAWSRLPEREGRLLDRYYREGKTFAQIGQEFGCDPTRAKQIHDRAVERLRQLLGPDAAWFEG